MALYIPPEHAEAFAGLTGSQWPEADEDRLRALAEEYQDLAGELESLQTHLHEFVNAIKNSTEGEFAKAFGEYANQYITPGKEGQIPLETAVKGARGMYKYLRNVAAQVEYMKIQAIAQLIFMAIEIAIAIALAVPTGGLSLLKIASIRALAQAVLRLLMQLLIATIISLVMETIFAAILDAATQQWQIDQGLRDGWDQDLTDAAMKGAAISGALGGIASLGAQALGKTLTKLLGKAFNSKFMNKMVPFNKIGSKLQDFDVFLGKGVKDAFGEQNAKFGAGMASTTKNFSTYMMTGFGNPKIANFSGIKGLGKLSAGAGHNFKNQLGEVFAKNFGENLGEQQAKKVGEQVAEKITKNIGKNPVHVLSKELDEVLAPYQKELGEKTVESLVKKYPEAIQQAVKDHHKPGKLFMLGTSVLGSPVHGAHGVLSEGFNNLFFGDEKEFKVSWYSFTGGAVMGAAESLGEQFVGDPLSDKLKEAVWGPPGMSTSDGATGANVPTESDATKLGGSPTGGDQPTGGDSSNGDGSSSTEHKSAAEDDAIQWWMADTENSSEGLGEFPGSTGSQHSAPDSIVTETGPGDDRSSSPDDFDGDVLELDEHGNLGTDLQQSEVQGNDQQAVTTPSGVAPPTQVQTTAGPQPNQAATPNTQVTPKAGGPSASLHDPAPANHSAQTSPNAGNTPEQPVSQPTTSVPESGSAPTTDNGSPNTTSGDQHQPTPVVTSSEPNTYSAQTDTGHSTELPDADNPNPAESRPEQHNVDEWQEDPGKPRFVPPEEHEQFQRNMLNIDLLGTTPDEHAALNDELGAADDVPATTSLLDNGMFIAEQDSNPDTVLEPDLFGLLDPAPSFVPTDGYGPGFENLTAQQGVHLLEQLDLAHAAPRDPAQLDFEPLIPPGLAAEELVGSPVPVAVHHPTAQQWAPASTTPLPKQLEMPHVRHSIWLGGPITDLTSAATGKATMMANLEHSAKELGAQGKVVLWTDVPRDQFANPPTQAVLDMKTWAQDNGVILANVHEVFNAAAPMKLQQPFQSEMVKNTKAGYAAASDILRMELLKRFGGVYSDGEYRTGKDYFAAAAQVATSGPGYGVHVLDNSNAGNDLFVMGKGHPFADFYLDHLGANYLKTQSELVPAFQQNLDAEAGPRPYHDYALNIFPARRHTVMFQTGPNAMEAMAAELGLGGVKGFPQSPSDAMRSGSSWTKPESSAPTVGADDLPASIALTKNVVQTLVKELHSRGGDLHLTLVNELVSKHERPDIIWTAAIGYLASHPELANLVTSVTDVTTVSDKGGGFHEEKVELPPQALKHLQFGPGDRTHSLAEFSRPATMVQPDAAGTETSPLTFFDGEDTATTSNEASTSANPVELSWGGLTEDTVQAIYDVQQGVADEVQESLHAAGTTTTTVLQSRDNGFVVDVEHFPVQRDPDWPIKQAALQKALDRMDGAGFRLPGKLTVSVAAPKVDGVLTQMMHLRDGEGNPSWHMFLGPSVFADNDPNPGTDKIVRGGAGDRGLRGVAHRVAEAVSVNSLLKRIRGAGKFNSDSVAYKTAIAEATVVHELGHALHTANNPTEFLLAQHKAMTKQGESKPGQSAMDVSHYATRNGLEFVAEVFTASAFGEKLSPKVVAEYEKLGGAPLKQAAHDGKRRFGKLTFFDGEDTATTPKEASTSVDAPGSAHQDSVEESAGEQLVDFDDVQPVEEFLKDFGTFSDAPKLEVPEHGAGDLRENFQQTLDLLQELPPDVPTSLVRDGFIAARNTRLLRMFDVVPGPGGGLSRKDAAEQLAGKVVQKLPFTNSVAVNSLRDQFTHLVINRGEMGFLQDLSQGKLFMVDTQEVTADGVGTVQKDIVLTLEFTGLHQAEADTNVQQKSVTESSTKFEQSVENARKTAFNGVIGAALSAAQAVIGVTPTLTTGGERGNKYGSRYSDDVSGTMKLSSAKKTFDVDAVLHWEELTKSGDTGPTGQAPFGPALVAYPKENVGPAVDAVRTSTPSRADAVDLPTKLTELVAAIDMVKLGDLHKHVLSNVQDSVRQDKVLWHNLSDSINAGRFEEASAHSLPHGFSITHKSEHGQLLPQFRFWQSTKPAEVTAHFKPKFRGYEDLGPFTGNVGTDSRSTLEDLQESSTTMGAEPGIRVGGAGEILPNVQIAPTAHIGAGATSKHTDTNKVAWSDKQKLLEAGPPMRLVRLDASFQVDLETREFGAAKTVTKDLGESRDGAYYVTVEESKYQALVEELDAALANQKPEPAEPTPKPELDPQRKKALSDAVSNDGLVSGLKYIHQADQVFDKTLDLITGHLEKQGVELTAADLRDLKRQLSGLNARDLAAKFNRFTHSDGELPDQPLKLTVDHGKRHYQITVDGVLGEVLAEHRKTNLVSTGTSSYSTSWRERDKNTVGIRGTLSALVRARLSSEGYGRPNYVGAGLTAQVKGEVHRLGGHLSAFGHEDKVKYTGPGSVVERGVTFHVQVEETLDVGLGDRVKKAVTKSGDLVAVAQSQIKTDLGKVQVDAVTGHQVPDFLIDAQAELTGEAVEEHLQQNAKELRGGVLVWSPDHYQQLNREFKDLQTKLGNDSKLWLTKKYANAVDLTRQWFDVAQQSAGQAPQTRNLGAERGYLFDRRGAGTVEFKYFNPTPLPVVEGMTWQHVNTSEKSVHDGEGAGIAGDAGISVLFGAGEFGLSAGYQAERGDRDTYSGAGKVTSAPTPSPVLLYKADQLATMSWATWQELWGQSSNHGADVAPKLVKATQDHVEVLFPNSSVVAVTAEQAVAQGLPLPDGWQPPTVEPVAMPDGVPVLNGLGHGLDKDVKVLDFSLTDEENLADQVTKTLEKHFSKLAPPTADNAQTPDPAGGNTKPSAFGAILRANGLNGLHSTGVVQQILKGGWEHTFTRGNFFSGSTRYTVKITFEPDGNPVQLVHHPASDNPVPPVQKPTGGSAETSGSSAVEHQGSRSVKFTVGGVGRPMVPSGSGSTGPAVVAGGHLSDGVEVSNTVTDNYQHRSRTGDAAQFEQPGKFKIELIKVSKPALLVSELTNGHAGSERFRNPDSRTVHTDAFAGKVRLEVPEGLLNTGTAAQAQGVAAQLDPETGKVPGEITDEVRGSSFTLAKVVPGDLAAKVGALIGKSGHREHSAFSPGTEHRAKLDALLSTDVLLGNAHEFAGPDGHAVKFELPEGTRNEQIELKVKMRFANPVHDASWDLPATQQKHDQKRATDYAETEEQAAYAGLGYAAMQPPANNNAAIQLNYKGAGRNGDQSTFKLEGNEKVSKATLERFHSDVIYEIEVHKQLRGGGWTKVGGETLLYEKSAAFDLDPADAAKFRPNDTPAATFWDGAGDSPTSTDIPANADELTGGDPEYAAYVANLLELADAETPEAFDAIVQSLQNGLPRPDALTASNESLNLSELEFGTPIQAHAQSLRGSSDEQTGSPVESLSPSQLAAMEHDIRERLARLHRSVHFDARTPVPLARDNAVTTDAGLVAVGEQSVGDPTAAGEKLVDMIVGAVEGSLAKPLTQAEQAALDALPEHLAKLAAGDGLTGLLSKKIWLPLGGGRNLSLDLIPNSATHLANFDPGSPVQKAVLETTPSTGASASHAHKTGVNLTGGVIADVASGGLLYVLPLVNMSGETTNKVGTTQTESNLHVRKTRFTDVFDVGFDVRTTLHQAGADPVAVTGKLPEKIQLAYPAEAVGPESTEAPHLLPPGGQAKPLPADVLTLIANVEGYTDLRDFQDTVLTGIANAVPHAGGLIKNHADRLSDAGLMDNYLRGVAAKLSVQVSGVVPKDPNRPAVAQLGPKADAVARYVRNKIASNDHRIDLKTTGELHLTAFQKVSTAEIDAGTTHRNSFGTNSGVTSTGGFLAGVTVRGLQAIESLMAKVHGRKGQVGANFDLRMSANQSKGVTAGTKAFFKEKSFHTAEATRYRLDLRVDHTTSIEVGGKARPDKPEGSHVISAYVWVRNTDVTKFENLLDASMADAPHRPPLPAPSALTPELKRDLRTLTGNGRLTDLRHLHGSGQVLDNALGAVRDLLLRDTSLTAEQRLKLYDEAREKLADLDPVKLVRAGHKIGTTSISTEVELNGHTYVVHSDQSPGEAVAEFAEQLAKQDIPLGDQEWLEVLDQLEANQRARARDENAHTVEFDLGGKKVEVSLTGRPKDIRSAEHIEHASLSSTRGTEASASNSVSNDFSLSGVLNARFRIQHATEGVASRLYFNLNGGGRIRGSANTGSTAGSAAAHEIKAAYNGPAVLLQQDLDLDVKVAVTGKNGAERTYNSTVGTVAEYLVPEFKAAHADELHAGTTEILAADADLTALGPQLGPGKAMILSSPVEKVKQLFQTYSKDLQLAGAAGQKSYWGNWIDKNEQLPAVRGATAIASKLLPFGRGPKFHVPTDPDAFATALAAAEHGPQLLAKGIKPGFWGHYDLVVSESANVKLYGSKVIGEIPPDVLKISSANKLSSNAAFNHGDSIGGGGDLHVGVGGLDGVVTYSKSTGTGETSSRSGWWKTTQQVAPGEKLVMVLAHAVVDQQVNAGQHALHSDALNPYPAHGSTLTKSYLLRDSHVLVMTERDANAWLENSFTPPPPGTLRPTPGLADLGKSVSADITVQELAAGQPLGKPFLDALAQHAPALVRDENQVAVELIKQLDHPAVQQELLNGGKTLNFRAGKKWGGRFFGLHVWAEPAPGWKEHQQSVVRPLPGSKAVTENQRSEGEQHTLSSTTSKAGTLAFNVLPGTDDPLVFPGPSAQFGKSSFKSTELSTGFAQQHGSRSERSDADVEVDVPVTLHYEIKQYSVGSYLYETIAPSYFRKMQATPVPMPEGTGTAPAMAKLRMPEYLLDLPSTGSALRPGGFPAEKQGEDLTAKVRGAKSLQVVKQNLDGVVDLAAEVIGKAAKSGEKVLPAAQRFAGPASPHRKQLEELLSAAAMVSDPQAFMKGEVVTSMQLAEKFFASDYVVGLKYQLDKPVLVEQVGTSGGESLQGGVFSSAETTSKSTGLVHGAGEVTMRDIGYISPDVVDSHKHTTTSESNDGIDLQGRTRSGGETRYVYAFDVQYTAAAWVVSAFGETNHHQDAVRDGGLLLSFTKEEAEAMGLPLPQEPGQNAWDQQTENASHDGDPVPDGQQLFVDVLNTEPANSPDRDDDVVEGLVDGKTVQFKVNEFESHELRDKNGELFGVSFAEGEQLKAAQNWAAKSDAAPAANYSVPLADLHEVSEAMQKPDRGDHLKPVDWGSGRGTFVINAHATEKHFTVVHSDGSKVKLRGDAFAKVVKHSGYFTANQNRDYLMLACKSGKLTGPGGSAYDFQQALAQFDSGAVRAPSSKVATMLLDSVPVTVLNEGGDWNTFGDATPTTTATNAGEATQQHSAQEVQWYDDDSAMDEDGEPPQDMDTDTTPVQSVENEVFSALSGGRTSANTTGEPMDAVAESSTATTSTDPEALQQPPFNGEWNDHLNEKDITGGFVQTEPGITAFRWLDENPALVLEYGLQPKDASYSDSIETHVTTTGKTQFVSTTMDEGYWHNKRRYRYEIRAPRPGIDIEKTFKKRAISWSAASWEKEAAFLGTIRPEDIVEVAEVDETGAPKTIIWSAENGPPESNPRPAIRDIELEGPSDRTPNNTRKNSPEIVAEDLVEAAVRAYKAEHRRAPDLDESRLAAYRGRYENAFRNGDRAEVDQVRQDLHDEMRGVDPDRGTGADEGPSRKRARHSDDVPDQDSAMQEPAEQHSPEQGTSHADDASPQDGRREEWQQKYEELSKIVERGKFPAADPYRAMKIADQANVKYVGIEDYEGSQRYMRHLAMIEYVRAEVAAVADDAAGDAAALDFAKGLVEFSGDYDNRPRLSGGARGEGATPPQQSASTSAQASASGSQQQTPAPAGGSASAQQHGPDWGAPTQFKNEDGEDVGYFVKARNSDQVLLVDKVGAAHLGTWRDGGEDDVRLAFQHWHDGKAGNPDLYFRELKYLPSTGEISLIDAVETGFLVHGSTDLPEDLSDAPPTKSTSDGTMYYARPDTGAFNFSPLALGGKKKLSPGNFQLAQDSSESWLAPHFRDGHLVQYSADGRWTRTAHQNGAVDITAVDVADTDLKAKVVNGGYVWLTGTVEAATTAIGKYIPVEPGNDVTTFGWTSNQPPAAVVDIPVDLVLPRPEVLVNPKLTFRIDRRSPAEILSSASPEALKFPGFHPLNAANTTAGRNISLIEYAAENKRSMYVSATFSANLQIRNSDWRYWIFAPGGIDLNKTLSFGSKKPQEREVTFAGGVDEKFVMGYEYAAKDPGKFAGKPYRNGDFELNPRAFEGMPPEYLAQAAAQVIETQVDAYLESKSKRRRIAVVDKTGLEVFAEPLRQALENRDAAEFSRVLAELRAKIAAQGTPA
ncbi:hypothetical protein LZ318_03740 [Saccharopolyspora indica]|uniref:scabin-related ADP-ribosyltransferase n=1 Tax=Saccharopolyspora indica TaxID=1229659 RepID=UPI0022EA2BEF|nr:hypothetical protein [Saccharopolyspora indica]MDA3644960.1 hypothetical protein [Saccharopolyspora indica]